MQDDSSAPQDEQQTEGVDIIIRPTAELTAAEGDWDLGDPADEEAIGFQIGLDTDTLSVDVDDSFEVPRGCEGAIADRDEDTQHIRPDFIPLADTTGKVHRDWEVDGYCLTPGRYLYDGQSIRIVERYPQADEDDD